MSQITLQDVGLVIQLIEVVSKRGAIMPQEMSDVGALHIKLTDILKTAQEKVKEETPEEE